VLLRSFRSAKALMHSKMADRLPLVSSTMNIRYCMRFAEWATSREKIAKWSPALTSCRIEVVFHVHGAGPASVVKFRR
jgi:hypothetical protein